MLFSNYLMEQSVIKRNTRQTAMTGKNINIIQIINILASFRHTYWHHNSIDVQQ